MTRPDTPTVVECPASGPTVVECPASGPTVVECPASGPTVVECPAEPGVSRPALHLPTTCSDEARTRWAQFHWRHLTRRSGERQALEEVITADPTWAVPYAWRALSAVMFGWAGIDRAADIARAQARPPRHDWERSLVTACARTVAAGLWPSKPAWLAHNDAHPAELLGVTMAHFLIDLGAGDDLLAGAAEDRLRLAYAHVGEHPALLGALGMVAQDRGDLTLAYEMAERSLVLDPTGLTGGHPRAHVFFESDDHGAGLEWLDSWFPATDAGSPLHGHLTWHGALHSLALGDGEDALRRYGALGPERLVDRSSLLWRCQLHSYVTPGADPAGTSLAPLVRPLMSEVPSTFVGWHVALALATARDAEGLRAFADRAVRFAAPGAPELLPALARALAEWIEGSPAAAAQRLVALEPNFVRFGGSHAQREVLDDTLIRVLTEAGRFAEASARLQARLDRRTWSSPLGRVRAEGQATHGDREDGTLGNLTV